MRWIAGRGGGSWSVRGGRAVVGGILACIFVENVKTRVGH